MIEGINLLISIFIGCIVFIYYTNALFKPRTKYLYANISIIVGYMMLYAISSFYQPTLNVIAFSIATFVLMYLCFKVTLKNAIIQAFMLTAIMMLAEGVLFMFTGIGIYPKGLLDVSLSARIIHAVLSKLIYFLGIIIAKHVAKGKSKYEEIDGFLSLLAIPFFTIMVIVSIMSVFPQINERIRVIFALIIVFGIIANIIVYWVHGGKGYNNDFVCAAVNKKGNVDILKYVTDTKSWKIITSNYINNLIYYGFDIMDNHIYLTGGYSYDSREVSDKTYSYDILTDIANQNSDIPVRTVGFEYEQTNNSEIADAPEILNVNAKILDENKGIYELYLDEEDYNYDTRSLPFFFWSAREGMFAGASKDYRRVIFYADPNTGDRKVKVVVGIGDGRGYVDKKSFLLNGNKEKK